MITHIQNYIICKYNFLSSFQIEMAFLLFSWLFIWIRNSRTMLNRSGKRRHPCLMLDFKRNIFPSKYDGRCGGFEYVPYHIEKIFFYSQLVEYFFFKSWMGVIISQALFLCLLRWCDFCHWLIWYIALTDVKCLFK